MFKFQFPATGPLSTPLVRSYLRRKIIDIRHHYKKVYLRCVSASLDGVLSFSVVCSLIKQSGAHINTFTVFSYIVQATNTGKNATPCNKLYSMFAGVLSGHTIKIIILYLKRIKYIKQHGCNPFNPSGPVKHFTLLPAGKEYYKGFSLTLENYFLKMEESDTMPQVRTGRSTNRLPRLNHTTRLQNKAPESL